MRQQIIFFFLLLAAFSSVQAASLPNWALAVDGSDYYILTSESAAGWYSVEQAKIDIKDGYAVVGEYNPKVAWGNAYKTVEGDPLDYAVEVKVRSVDVKWYLGVAGNLQRVKPRYKLADIMTSLVVFGSLLFK